MIQNVRKPTRHGVRTTYIKNGCRCKECVSANSAYLKNYRRKASSKSADTPEYEYQKIAKAAVEWIMVNRPDVYDELRKGIAYG